MFPILLCDPNKFLLWYKSADRVTPIAKLQNPQIITHNIAESFRVFAQKLIFHNLPEQQDTLYC